MDRWQPWERLVYRPERLIEAKFFPLSCRRFLVPDMCDEALEQVSRHRQQFQSTNDVQDQGCNLLARYKVECLDT